MWVMQNLEECGVHSSKIFITVCEQVFPQNSISTNLLINFTSKQHEIGMGLPKVRKIQTEQRQLSTDFWPPNLSFGLEGNYNSHCDLSISAISNIKLVKRGVSKVPGKSIKRSLE